ncbi:MAG: radical SAM/SPASM domain-containing protein [Lachnospiraceae bacterium]
MDIMQKPELVRKLRQFQKTVRRNNGHIGHAPRIIDLSYDNACNFKCEHCFTKAPEHVNTNEHIPLERIAEIADEAHELGFYEFDLQGGELLLNPDLFFKLLETIKPERFYVYLTTNGYLLTEEIAKKMAEMGINRVSVSIDSMNAEEHDSFRGKSGAHERALKALEYVKKYNIEAYMNITVGHYNAFSEDVENLVKYSQEHGYHTIFNVAVPAGCWQGNTDIMLNEEERKHLMELRKKYDFTTRDLWNPFDRDREGNLGCNCVNMLYITPKGDVLPCPFVHIKLGNIYENTLEEIMNYGFSIPEFGEYSEKCLAGEDKTFVQKYMNQPMSTFEPVDAKKLFKEVR